MRAQANAYQTPVPAAGEIAPVANIVDVEVKSPLNIWVAIVILYLLWDFLILRTKAKDVIEPSNIRTNLYNLFFIGVASLIFFNGFKVLLVKIAAWNIPGISWLAEKLLPLVQV